MTPPALGDLARPVLPDDRMFFLMNAVARLELGGPIKKASVPQ
jgi:hypothetical protein